MGWQVVVDGWCAVLWLFGEDVRFSCEVWFCDMIWVWRLLPEESLQQRERGRADST